MDDIWLKTKADEIRTATIILSKAQISRDSIRNAFYTHFKGKKTSKRMYNTVYWLVLEIARKSNILVEYTRKLNSRDPFLKKLAIVLVFTMKEAVYKDGRPVDLLAAREIAKIVLNEKGKDTQADFLIFLDSVNSTSLENILEGKNSVEKQSLIYGYPKWMVRLFNEKLGVNETKQVMQAGNNPKKIWIRRNNAIVDEKKFINSLVDEGFAIKPIDTIPDAYELMTPVKKKAFSTIAYKRGWFEFQGLSSIAMATMISADSKSEDMILELAAAPGMKAAVIIQQSQGRYIGCDLSKRRVSQLLTRMRGISRRNSRTHRYSILNSDSRKLPLKNESVDRILADLPCSSSGVFTSYPDLRWLDPDRIKKYTLIQEDILREGLRVLKPGGNGVYSVCSITPEEGEELLTKFVENNDIIIIDCGNDFGAECYQKNSEGEDYPSSIQTYAKRTWPHLHGTDCFFFAKFYKPA